MRNYKIYSLVCPVSGEVRYVGKTISNLQRRLNNHISSSLRKKSNLTHKESWIRKLNKQGYKPVIKLLEICTEDTWQEKEKEWISFYSNLTNSTLGGECEPVNIKKIPILKYSLNGEFLEEYESLQQAMDLNGYKKGTLDSAVNRNPERVFCKGFLWRVSNLDFKKYLSPYISPKIKPVIIIDLSTQERKIFESLKEGLIYFGLSRVGAINTAIDKGVPYKQRYFIVFL